MEYLTADSHRARHYCGNSNVRPYHCDHNQLEQCRNLWKSVSSRENPDRILPLGQYIHSLRQITPHLSGNIIRGRSLYRETMESPSTEKCLYLDPQRIYHRLSSILIPQPPPPGVRMLSTSPTSRSTVSLPASFISSIPPFRRTFSPRPPSHPP